MKNIPPPPPPKVDSAGTTSTRFNGPWSVPAGPPPWPGPADVTDVREPQAAHPAPSTAPPDAAVSAAGGAPKKPRFGMIPHPNFTRLVACRPSVSVVLVYAYLCICRNAKTGRCDPKRKTIARETGLNPTTVSDALTALVSFGLVVRHEHHAGSARNRYELTGFPPPTGAPKASGSR